MPFGAWSNSLAHKKEPWLVQTVAQCRSAARLLSRVYWFDWLQVASGCQRWSSIWLWKKEPRSLQPELTTDELFAGEYTPGAGHLSLFLKT
jgi:hypothetical protein